MVASSSAVHAPAEFHSIIEEGEISMGYGSELCGGFHATGKNKESKRQKKQKQNRKQLRGKGAAHF